MTLQGRSAGAGESAPSAWTPVVVLPILAFIVDAGVYYLGTHGYRLSYPLNLLGGFTLNLSVSPLLESIILAFALAWWSGLSAGRAVIAAIVLYVVRLIVTLAWGYAMGQLLAILPLSLLTQSTSFYAPLFLQTAVTGASVLLVLAIYERAFRAWWPWILTLLVWAGGATLLFVLFHDQIIARDSYAWLAHGMRALGFLVLGYYFRLAAR
jgi:hypothetical protein